MSAPAVVAVGFSPRRRVSAIDAQQDGLGGGTAVTAIGLGVLSQDHGWPDLRFPEVVVRGHVGIIEKREHVLRMAGQAFAHSLRVGVLVLLMGQLAYAAVQSFDSALISIGREVQPLAQMHAIGQRSAGLLGEGLPLGGLVAHVHVFQFAHQMGYALPRIGRIDPIVRRREVGDEGSIDRLSQELLQHRTSAIVLDRVIDVSRVGETPQPTFLPVHPPPGFVGVQNRRTSGLLDVFIPFEQHDREPLPHINEAAGRRLGLQMIRENVDDLIDGQAQTVVEPAGQGDQVMPEHGPGHGMGDDRLDVPLALRGLNRPTHKGKCCGNGAAYR